MNGGLDRPGARLICFTSIWLAGVFSSTGMLTAKQTMELVEMSLVGENQFTNSIPFVILVNFAVSNFLMEYWKQKALANFSALVVVPCFQVCLVVLSVVGGAIYFGEFDGMEPYRIVLFLFGLGVVCAGILLLSAPGPEDDKRGKTMYSMACVVVFAQRLRRRARSSRDENMEGGNALHSSKQIEGEQAGSVPSGQVDSLAPLSRGAKEYPPSRPEQGHYARRDTTTQGWQLRLPPLSRSPGNSPNNSPEGSPLAPAFASMLPDPGESQAIAENDRLAAVHMPNTPLTNPVPSS